MKKAKIFLSITFLLMSFLFYGFLNGALLVPGTENETELEGKWESVVKGLDMTFTFSGDGFSVTTPNPAFWYKGTFVIQTDKNPKQISMTIKRSGIPAYIEKISLGIYELKDDILVMLMNQPGYPGYPESFEKKGSAVQYKLRKCEAR